MIVQLLSGSDHHGFTFLHPKNLGLGGRVGVWWYQFSHMLPSCVHHVFTPVQITLGWGWEHCVDIIFHSYLYNSLGFSLNPCILAIVGFFVRTVIEIDFLS